MRTGCPISSAFCAEDMEKHDANLSDRISKMGYFYLSSYLQNCLQTEDMRQITTCNLHRILQSQVAVDQAPPYPRWVWGGEGWSCLCEQAGVQPPFLMVRHSSEIICNPLRHDLQSPWSFASGSISCDFPLQQREKCSIFRPPALPPPSAASIAVRAFGKNHSPPAGPHGQRPSGRAASRAFRRS
jgi:hypothetical protein